MAEVSSQPNGERGASGQPASHDDDLAIFVTEPFVELPGLDRLTEPFLRQAYVAEGRSTTSISGELGVEAGQVLTALYRYKIPVRDKAAARVARKPALAELTEDYLRAEFVEMGRTQSSIVA